jgi:hypothetical protein
MQEKGSALIGILVSLVILAGLSVMGAMAFSSGGVSTRSTAGSTVTQSPPAAARTAVNGTELAEVQSAADAYATVNGSIPADTAALVAGGEIKAAPHCNLVIDPATGTVSYGPTQSDPACHA